MQNLFSMLGSCKIISDVWKNETTCCEQKDSSLVSKSVFYPPMDYTYTISDWIYCGSFLFAMVHATWCVHS